MNFIIFLLFLLTNIWNTVNECSALNFREKLNQAVSKAKSIYKNQYGKDKTWHFLGYDKSEYPGADKAMRKIQADKWEEYYECLKKQENNFGKHGSIIPEAVLALEGESIKLECKVCISPSENDMDAIEWDWSHSSAKFLEPVEYGEHILISPDKILHIYNAGPDNVGQYVCRLGKQLTTPFFVTVVNTSEPLTMVHPETAPNGPYKQPAWKIHPQIMLDTYWTDWSTCSTCDIVGKRYKYGHCLIFLVNSINELEENTDNGNNTEITSEDTANLDFVDMTNNGSVELSRVDMEFLHIFKYGIPCRSHILPKTIKDIPIIRDRKSELMVGYCKVKCPKDEVYIVKDKKGNVIETANNSAGIYSMAQGLPPLDPPVERLLQFGSVDKDIVLTCPGNLNTESPISWQIGSKHVIPSLLSKESAGRMFISITDRMHIKKAKKIDSNIYSCWQENKLAGTIRLEVEKTIELNFSHHVMLVAVIIILLTFNYVFIKAFLGRRYVQTASK